VYGGDGVLGIVLVSLPPPTVEFFLQRKKIMIILLLGPPCPF